MRLNKKLAFMLVLTTGICLSTTVFAEEFKSKNGVVSVETQGNNWKVTEAEDSTMTLTDGENVITIQHFSNGEKLPEIEVADEEYAQVCQNIISTKDEVFVVTGFAADSADFKEVQDAVQSSVINKFGTKKSVKEKDSEINKKDLAVNSERGSDINQEVNGEITADSSTEYKVKSAAFTGWVDGSRVNVRSSYSTDSEILGQVYFQDVVFVTADVKNSDGNVEWYQIDYNGEEGYIAAAYISHSPTTAEMLGYVMTDEQKVIYLLDGSEICYVNKATNGNWYDGSGRQYIPDGYGNWTLSTDGSRWSETDPDPGTPADDAVDEVNIMDEGDYNRGTLYLGEDGVWRNVANGIFTDNGDGTFTGMDGTIWHVIE